MTKFNVGDVIKYKDDVAESYGYSKSAAVVEGIKRDEDPEKDVIFFRYTPDGKLYSACAGIIELYVDSLPGEKIIEDCDNGVKPITVCILGTTYTIVEKPLKDCDGYCDKTTKEIAIATKDNDCDLGNFGEYRKKVLRHEIIHAYHHESGLDNNLENKQYGFSETLVDWFAIQSPKIFKTFEELDIL